MSSRSAARLESVVIFARRPLPGAVKTRLAREIGDRAAAAVYRCFLADLLARFPSTETRETLAAVAPPAEGFATDLGWAPESCFAQTGADLGARMLAAFRRELEARERDACIVIGSDLPQLAASTLDAAFAALADGADVALGPADDGGYYLIGLREPWDLFTGVAWSTPHVLSATRARAKHLGLSVVETKLDFDVDERADLERLRALLASGAPAVPPCPATAAWFGRPPARG